MADTTVPLLFNVEDIVETVREPMLVLSADLKVRRANRSFYRTFKVTQEETVDRLVYDLGNRQWDIPALRKLLEEVLPQDRFFEDFEVVHEFDAIGQKVMLLNARRIFHEGNNTEFILLAIEDITERRRLEEQRRQLETRFTALVRNIKDHSVFTLDQQGKITSWNVEAERILGWSEAEALGRHFSIIFTPEDLERNQPETELRTAREKGRAEDERWHIRKNGERFWALGIVTPTHDAEGNNIGYSKILRDMTDRKRAEEALRKAHDELERRVEERTEELGRANTALREADRRKDEFLATLAHELRNPLAPIRNSLEILKMPTVDSGTAQQTREMMERQVQHLVRLVDDLLDVSRVMRAKIELRRERVELAFVVARAVESAQPLIEAQGHQLEIALPPDALLLDADPVRLAQVVGNLLTNAAKYTEAKGHIWLTARREGDHAVLSVRDMGIGIAPAMLTHIFELFVQADNASTKSQGGLGIGLTLVKNLVEMHSGTVEARSAGLGKGSEFLVRLPLMVQNRQPQNDEAKEEQQQETSPSGHRLLVVDDNIDAANSLAMLLRLKGHEVQVAHDGPSALELAKSYRPDMVLLDIGMPVMDGNYVARRMRQTPGLENTILAALTGWGQEEDRRRSAEAGFNYHLVKPPEPKALESLLAGLKRPEAR
jgi:PAS domain S-box-containing protein